MKTVSAPALAAAILMLLAAGCSGLPSQPKNTTDGPTVTTPVVTPDRTAGPAGIPPTPVVSTYLTNETSYPIELVVNGVPRGTLAGHGTWSGRDLGAYAKVSGRYLAYTRTTTFTGRWITVISREVRASFRRSGVGTFVIVQTN